MTVNQRDILAGILLMLKAYERRIDLRDYETWIYQYKIIRRIVEDFDVGEKD